MTDEELIAKFQARVADGEIDLRPFGELIFGKFDQDWPARLIALARRGAAVCQIPAGEITDLDLAKIKEAVAGARHGPKGCLLLKTEDVAALIARLEASDARNATAYAEGVEAAAKVAENYLTMDHIAWDGHNSIFPKSSTIPD